MTADRTETAPSALRRLALSGFQAACEALYPDNDFGAPSWRDADMVARASLLWDELPPSSRLLMETLYSGLELGGAALALWVGPLSKVPIARRERMFERMRTSRVWPLRFIAEAVKSSSTMVYMSHPAVLRYIGVSKACADPADAHLAAPVKSGVFEVINARPAKEAS